MAKKDSQGRHGGNRGSAATRTDDNPNKAAAVTEADSRAGDRNPGRAGGRRIGDR
jgi:hypothetical protein